MQDNYFSIGMGKASAVPYFWYEVFKKHIGKLENLRENSKNDKKNKYN